VEGLARRLDSFVNGRNPSDPLAAPLVVLQTFGHPGSQPEPTTTSFWANDQVPPSDRTVDWANGSFAKKPADLFKMWNPQKGANGTKAAYPTVSGVVGQLAGLEGHDKFANFGYGFAEAPPVNGSDPAPSRDPYPRARELGLTVVATAHAFDRNSGYVERRSLPADAAASAKSPLDGGVVGTLRRNNQGQWQLTNPSLAESLPTKPAGQDSVVQSPFDTQALWNLAFAQPTPWPCSEDQPAPCSGAGQAKNAMAYITSQVFKGSNVLDVRSLYTTDTISDTTLERHQGDINALEYPPPSQQTREPIFLPDDLNHLKTLIASDDGELAQVVDVKGGAQGGGVQGWQNLLKPQTDDAGAIKEKIVDVVLRDEDEKKIEAQIDAKEAASSSLLIFSEVSEIAILAAEAAGEEVPFIGAAVPSVVGVVSAAIDLSSEVSPENPNVSVDHAEQAIRTDASNLAAEINHRFSDIHDTLGHLSDVLVSDAGKLKQADQNFDANLKWNFGQDSSVEAQRASTVATHSEFYESLMPEAFRLAVVSPHRTGDPSDPKGANPNGPPDDLRTYDCWKIVQSNDSDDWSTDGTLQPFDKLARSGFTTLHHRRVDGPDDSTYPRESGTAAQIGLALKGLRAKFNVQDIDNEQIGIRNRGFDPPKSMTDPLFRRVDQGDAASAPSSLGMDRDEFFQVLRWQQQKIQCGPS
jgi:hypothetical protein